MPEKFKLSVEQFKLACVSDDVMTDDQVYILAKNVVINSEDEVREFAAVLEKYRPNLVRRFFPDIPYTKEEILEMWEQAAGELRGFRNHLRRTNAGITASQINMALQLADAEFQRLKESPKPLTDLMSRVCPELQNNFERFVNTGEATNEYLVHIDHCHKCHEAIEIAMDRQGKALEALGRYVRGEK